MLVAECIAEIKSLLPSLNWDISDESVAAYGQDKTPILSSERAAIVVKPDSDEQVQLVLKVASQYDVPVVMRGGGTGTTGGAQAVEGCVILSFELMVRILEIDAVNRVVVCEPGVITGDLKRAVELEGLYYPPDPGSLETCTIGGNVAENAGGPRCVKYGVTGHYVLGLSGFYVDGTPFSFGGVHYKNVAGYALKDVLVGSEGTLAVITRITLKLIPKPKLEVPVLLGFHSFDEAIRVLSSLRVVSEVPSVLEFFDDVCVQAAQEYIGDHRIPNRVKAFLIVAFDGMYQVEIDRRITALFDQNKTNLAYYWIPETPEDEAYLWKVRRSISPGLTKAAGKKMSHDVVVPPGEVGAYVSFLNYVSQDDTVSVLGYGHLADGNVHVNILKYETDEEVWQSKLFELEDKIIQKAIELGGTITGEHGIGTTKKRFLNRVFSEKDMAVMAQLKRVFDPKNLLNPGKVV